MAGGPPDPSPGSYSTVAEVTSSGELEQVGGVRAERVASARPGDVGHEHASSGGGRDDDLLPSEAALEVEVAELERATRGAGRRREDGVEAQRVEPGGAGPSLHAMLDGVRPTRRPSSSSTRRSATSWAKPGARTVAPSWYVGISARSSA